MLIFVLLYSSEKICSNDIIIVTTVTVTNAREIDTTTALFSGTIISWYRSIGSGVWPQSGLIVIGCIVSPGSVFANIWLIGHRS